MKGWKGCNFPEKYLLRGLSKLFALKIWENYKVINKARVACKVRIFKWCRQLSWKFMDEELVPRAFLQILKVFRLITFRKLVNGSFWILKFVFFMWKHTNEKIFQLCSWLLVLREDAEIFAVRFSQILPLRYRNCFPYAFWTGYGL